MMGYGSRYDPGYPPPPGRGGYDPRPPQGYDRRFDAFDPPMYGPEYGARGLPPPPPQGRGGKQNSMITPENKKKAAKLGAKGGKFAALFGFGKLKENVDMGEFEGFADKYGEDAIEAMGDHVEGAIDKANFGNNSRQPGRMQSRHLQDVVERRAREMSPDRGPAGPRGSYIDRDLHWEPYGLPRVPRNYDQRPPPPEDYPRDPRDTDRRDAAPRNFDQGPPADFNRGSRSLHDQLDNESRFGDVAYKDVPMDVRKAYERKLREQSAVNEDQRPRTRDINEDDRAYFMYPQGFSIQPRKKFDSPPPSYKVSAQHPAMGYPSDEPIMGPDPAFPMPGQMEYERPSNQLTHYRSY